MQELVLVSVYAALVLCSATAAAVQQLRFVAAHGKRSTTSHGCSRGSRGSRGNGAADGVNDSSIGGLLLQWAAGLTVPKRWFRHFYVLGSVCNALSIGYAANNGVSAADCMCLLMLQVHLLRRLVECSLITVFGDSTMHLSGYLVGLLHYILAPLCFSLRPGAANTVSPSIITQAFAVFVFTAANVLQYQSHRHLFELKLKAEALPPAQKYSLPTKGLFSWVACPHYFTEILIYASLCMASSWPNWAAVGLVLWVTSNLTVVAQQQMHWYKDTFPQLPRGWKILIPFIY